MSSFVITKKQLEQFSGLSQSDAQLVLKHISGKKLDRLSESAKDILIDTGLFEFHGNRLVSLVRPMTLADAVAAPAKVVRREPKERPAEKLVEHFMAVYRKRMRRAYVAKQEDVAHMQRLLKSLAYSDIEARISEYLLMPERYYPNDPKVASVRLLVTNINDIRVGELVSEPDEW